MDDDYLKSRVAERDRVAADIEALERGALPSGALIMTTPETLNVMRSELARLNYEIEAVHQRA